MGIISKFVLMLVGNGIGLYLANVYIPGFRVELTLDGFIGAALILTIINFFIKPILNLVFAPFIFLSLGLASILINASTLYLLDYLSNAVTISGLLPLLYATLIISAINFALNFLRKIF